MRFKPDNVIFDCREANILAILDKESGKIVWKIGPDFMQLRIEEAWMDHRTASFPYDTEGSSGRRET